MNLTLYFRLIIMSIFQTGITSGKKSWMGDTMSYNNTHFYSPRVVANDGFVVSLQINYCNYCSSENGYRTLGHTMEEVEFGFPSMNEELMFQYSEMYDSKSLFNDNEDYIGEENYDINTFDVTGTVGRIPVSVLETIFEKHGGIDWEATISVDNFNNLINK